MSKLLWYFFVQRAKFELFKSKNMLVNFERQHIEPSKSPSRTSLPYSWYNPCVSWLQEELAWGRLTLLYFLPSKIYQYVICFKSLKLCSLDSEVSQRLLRLGEMHHETLWEYSELCCFYSPRVYRGKDLQKVVFCKFIKCFGSGTQV